MALIAPSLLSADFAALGEAVKMFSVGKLITFILILWTVPS